MLFAKKEKREGGKFPCFSQPVTVGDVCSLSEMKHNSPNSSSATPATLGPSQMGEAADKTKVESHDLHVHYVSTYMAKQIFFYQVRYTSAVYPTKHKSPLASM